MTNSISFSSDLQTLFLIEEHQVVAFPLESKHGVVIGIVQGQLVAATQKDLNGYRNVKIETVNMDEAQVQFFYSDREKKAFIIIIDIDADKSPTGGTKSYKYRAFTYSLTRENLIIKKSANRITLIRVPNLPKIDTDGGGFS